MLPYGSRRLRNHEKKQKQNNTTTKIWNSSTTFKSIFTKQLQTQYKINEKLRSPKSSNTHNKITQIRTMATPHKLSHQFTRIIYKNMIAKYSLLRLFPSETLNSLIDPCRTTHNRTCDIPYICFVLRSSTAFRQQPNSFPWIIYETI